MNILMVDVICVVREISERYPAITMDTARVARKVVTGGRMYVVHVAVPCMNGENF